MWVHGTLTHLLQSELFDYERGTFTGVTQRKIGRVKAAHGGTLFLDEIGKFSLESQASPLRFLQEGRIERLGDHASIPVDVRVICATHVDIESALRAGRFRKDLYHRRLCVLTVVELPLRERGKDIEVLARHMLKRFRGDAIAAMHNYGWPGNVGELINRVCRASCERVARHAVSAEGGRYSGERLARIAGCSRARGRRTPHETVS